MQASKQTVEDEVAKALKGIGHGGRSLRFDWGAYN